MVISLMVCIILGYAAGKHFCRDLHDFVLSNARFHYEWRSFLSFFLLHELLARHFLITIFTFTWNKSDCSKILGTIQI